MVIYEPLKCLAFLPGVCITFIRGYLLHIDKCFASLKTIVFDFTKLEDQGFVDNGAIIDHHLYHFDSFAG